MELFLLILMVLLSNICFGLHFYWRYKNGFYSADPKKVITLGSLFLVLWVLTLFFDVPFLSYGYPVLVILLTIEHFFAKSLAKE